MPVQQTDIAWTDYSGNHWVACAKVSEGCANCWAADVAARFDRTPEPWTIDNAEENLRVYDGCFVEELASVSPGWVFTPSSSDPCLPWVPEEARREWYSALAQNDQHCYQVLTKWGAEDAGLDLGPLPDHVMLGVTVETERREYRLDWLREQDAAMKFVSFEPLLEPIEDPDLSGIDWAIVGGESGTERRQWDARWASQLREACREYDTKFFFKQHGDRFPEERVRLDGREWREFPETPDGVPDAPREFLEVTA